MQRRHPEPEDPNRQGSENVPEYGTKLARSSYQSRAAIKLPG